MEKTLVVRQGKRPRKGTARLAERVAMRLMVCPALAILALAYVWPFVRLIYRSLFDPQFTLQYYRAVFEMPAIAIVGRTTLSISVWGVIFCILLGYPVAYVMNKVKPYQASWIRILVVLPFFTSFMIRTYAWILLLGRQGFINGFLLGLGLVSTPQKMLYTRFAVHVGLLQCQLPLMILPLYSIMGGIDKELITAARNLGASPVQAFLRVFLPLSLPGVASGSVLIFIASLGAYLTARFLGGPNDQMLANFIEGQVLKAGSWSLAAAEASLLLILTAGALYLLQRVLKVNLVIGW